MALAQQPYPILRFLDGVHILFEVDASTWIAPQIGEEISLYDEKSGLPQSHWFVDKIRHSIVVRCIGEGEAARHIPLPLLRVTTVELLRLSDE